MQKITNKFKSILVSGASGDIGIGIGRILKSEGFDSVFGCDINLDSWGVCIFDEIHCVPRADAEDYISSLGKLVQKFNIDLFIPSSEAEIKALLNCRGSLKDLIGCDVLMANTNAINIALDKYATANFLKEHELDHPWTIIADQNKPISLPCIFKPRSGQGSKGLEIIRSPERAQILSVSNDYIFQELLLPDDQEYTCGVFRSSSGEIRSIIFNRVLMGGFTGKGTVVADSCISAYIEKISEALNVRGAINLQLRLTDRGPVLFEINPRLSSTVMFRHKMGFRDLIWAIEDLAGFRVSEYTAPETGTQFYRGLAEYFKN